MIKLRDPVSKANWTEEHMILNVMLDWNLSEVPKRPGICVLTKKSQPSRQGKITSEKYIMYKQEDKSDGKKDCSAE